MENDTAVDKTAETQDKKELTSKSLIVIVFK